MKNIIFKRTLNRINQLLCFCLLVSCGKKEDSEIPNPITITLKDSIFNADGKTEVEAFVIINNDFKKEYRTVHFRLSEGENKFPFGENNGLSQNVDVNNSGQASAKFKVGTIPGQFNINASIGSKEKYQDEHKFELKPYFIDFEIDTNGIKANGGDIIILIIKAKAFANKDFNLETTAGNIEDIGIGRVYKGKLNSTGEAQLNKN